MAGGRGGTGAKEGPICEGGGGKIRGEVLPGGARGGAGEGGGAPSQELPPRKNLVYLGEGDDRVLLYDQRNDRTVRVTAGDVHLEFPESC